MSLDYKIEKIKNGFDATANLKWYAGAGYYRVEVCGIGPTEEVAKKNCDLLAGQARAALHVALIEDGSNRVPQTPERERA